MSVALRQRYFPCRSFYYAFLLRGIRTTIFFMVIAVFVDYSHYYSKQQQQQQYTQLGQGHLRIQIPCTKRQAIYNTGRNNQYIVELVQDQQIGPVNYSTESILSLSTSPLPLPFRIISVHMADWRGGRQQWTIMGDNDKHNNGKNPASKTVVDYEERQQSSAISRKKTLKPLGQVPVAGSNKLQECHAPLGSAGSSIRSSVSPASSMQS